MSSWFKRKAFSVAEKEIEVPVVDTKFKVGQTYILEHVNKAGDKTYQAVYCSFKDTNDEGLLTTLNKLGALRPHYYQYYVGYYDDLRRWKENEVISICDAKDAIAAFKLKQLKEHSHTNVIKYP